VPEVRPIRARHYSLCSSWEGCKDSGCVAGYSEVEQPSLRFCLRIVCEISGDTQIRKGANPTCGRLVILRLPNWPSSMSFLKLIHTSRLNLHQRGSGVPLLHRTQGWLPAKRTKLDQPPVKLSRTASRGVLASSKTVAASEGTK
jgi:hypothetical protein